MSALQLTGADLIRTLANVAGRPAVAAAVRARADALAAAIEAEAAARGESVQVQVEPAGSRAVTVSVSVPGLFAREFGALDGPAEPLIAPAVARMVADASQPPP